MATFSKLNLSGSTQGRQIKVVATASPGTTVHTTGTSSSVIDEVWLYATNQDTVERTLTVQFGNTTSPDDWITLNVPAKAGLTVVVPGLTLSGTGAAGNVVRAFASAANVVLVSGYVNRVA
jgi:hypothetical protein